MKIKGFKEIQLMNKLYKLSKRGSFIFASKETFSMTDLIRELTDNGYSGYVQDFLHKCKDEGIFEIDHDQTIRGKITVFYKIKKKKIEKAVRNFIDDEENGRELLDFVDLAEDIGIAKL